ncbi:hypothetical protein ACLKA7_007165 [Drosophila subpalustris]
MVVTKDVLASTGTGHKPPFYCRVISISNIAQPLAANKPKLKPRLASNQCYRSNAKKRIPSKDDGKSSELIKRLHSMNLLPVLRSAKKSYDTKRLFYVPLNNGIGSKRCAPHDFQQMLTAAQRYLNAKQQAQDVKLLETLLPPPPQFADRMLDDERLWKWRMERTNTVTLYHIPRLQETFAVQKPKDKFRGKLN